MREGVRGKLMELVTYSISVHEGEPPIRQYSGRIGAWVCIESEVPLMGLRHLLRELRGEGYEDEAILIERE